MKFTIKDVFNLDNIKSVNEDNVCENSQTKRMKRLVESFNEKNEIIKEKTEKNINNEALKEEVQRNKNLSKHRINEYGNDSLNQSGMKYGGGYGQTVSGFNAEQSHVKKFANISKSELTDSEALEVAIKRALNSGTPVNNMSFYDEINWNLNQLGFSSKMPVDIKNSIIELIKYGTVKMDIFK